MSRISIDLKSANVEQYAAQLLTLLRENSKRKPTSGYIPGCLESILHFEFSPVERGLDIRGGVLRQPGGAVSWYGGDKPPDWLRKRYSEAVNYLRKSGYIVRDHTQSSDQFAEVTSDGAAVVVDTTSMLFLIPRPWTHWRALYENGVLHLGIIKGGDEFSGTAFMFAANKFATCEHNFVGDVVAYVQGEAIPVCNALKHSSADVAVFSLPDSIQAPLGILPLRHELPSPGEEIAILGFPSVPLRQPTLNISVGAVESLPTNYKGDAQYIQVSIPTAGGNSGGPVIDVSGRVVGVVTEKTFEAVADAQVPSRPFSQVVPIRSLLELL